MPQQRDFNHSLLYRGSQHGWTAADFHRLCDDQGPTLVLLKNTAGKRFGGFTTENWKDQCK